MMRSDKEADWLEIGSGGALIVIGLLVVAMVISLGAVLVQLW